MGKHDAIRESEKGVIAREGLRTGDVQSGRKDVLLLESVEQVGLVVNLSTTRVHKNRGGFHSTEGVCIEPFMGFVSQGSMDGYEVGDRQESVEIDPFGTGWSDVLKDIECTRGPFWKDASDHIRFAKRYGGGESQCLLLDTFEFLSLKISTYNMRRNFT